MALGTILQGVPAVASASQASSGFGLSDFGGLLQAGSALSSLFGGGGGGASANDLAESQLFYSLLGMKHAPYAQTVGLRRAGLNPMLAVTKGFGASPSVGMPSPVDDRQVATARGLAAASVANQAAQADLYSAQAAKTRAETPGNDLYQEHLASSAAANRQSVQTGVATQNAQSALADLHRASELQQNQLTKTEGWKSKLAELEFSREAELYPTRVKQLQTTVASMVEELKLAQRLGKINDSQFGEIMGYLQRFTESIGLSAGTLIKRGR